jgi:hypothetical protein
MKPSQAANDNLIDRTRKVWTPRLGRDLSCEDSRQIAENITGFFAILHEWSRASIPDSDNDNRAPSATCDSSEAHHDR